MRKLFLFSFLLAVGKIASAQTGFYDLQQIRDIHIYFSAANWDFMLDTAKAGSDGYVLADSILIEGQVLDSIGVKYKGNSSYNSTYAKNPLHLSLDEFALRDYQGITDIKLSNGYGDPSHIRECLGYKILSDYMDCPEANFSRIYVNGNYIGLYSSAENIGKKFCLSHFGSSNGAFIKGNPIITPGPTVKSNLKALSTTDSSLFYNYYELKSEFGWNHLMSLCDSIGNHPNGLESMLDMDRVIWMLAFNNLMINLDSYSGAFAQNYYLYKDAAQITNPVVWDLNMCFGGFPFLGTGATGMGSLTPANMQTLPLLVHQSDPYWPLQNAVLNNPSWRRMYVAHVKTIANDWLGSGNLNTLSQQLTSLIDSSVAADSNSFFTYNQFSNSLNSNTQVGSYQVPGIQSLAAARLNYLSSTAEFQSQAPAISNILPSTINPLIGSSFFITAAINNASSAWLYYRPAGSLHFQKTPMSDDGNHGDGAAADGQWGAGITMLNASLDYYIYSENNDAGIFSPERAAHNFYSITGQQGSVNNGIVINEVMASNTQSVSDNFGEYDDWIELYNNSTAAVDLSGYYLSDNPLNLSKWEIPQGTSISPGGYLIFWADEDSSQGGNHCNFKLSGMGESLMLLDATLSIIDSLSFGPQAPDVGLARMPNGSGPFVTQAHTYNGNNNNTSLTHMNPAQQFDVFPNPCSDFLKIKGKKGETLSIFNTFGAIVAEQTLMEETISLDIRNLAEGIYLLKGKNHTQKIIIVH